MLKRFLVLLALLLIFAYCSHSNTEPEPVETETVIIHDYNFMTGVCFFVDQYYQENFRFNPETLLPVYTPGKEIVELELWCSRIFDYLNIESEEAWAVADPENFIPDSNSVEDRDHKRAWFIRQELNVDYIVNLELGYIEMLRPIRFDEILAVGFTTADYRKVGHLAPTASDLSYEYPFILKLLRTQHPFPGDAGWYLEWRNVYDLDSLVYNEDFEIQIVLNKTAGRISVQDDGKSFLEIFGLDRLINTSGQHGTDDKIDKTRPFLIDYNKGRLILPGLRPFDPLTDPFTGGASMLLDKHRIPDFYDKFLVNQTDKVELTQFDIEIIYLKK